MGLVATLLVISGTALANVMPEWGDYNADIIQLHEKLSELGYYGLRPESPWSEASEDALKLTIATLNYMDGVEENSSEIMDEDIERILSAEGPLNLVWDGSFENVDKYWSRWGNPTLVEIVEIDGKNWMHLISSGEHWEGLRQDFNRRVGFQVPELVAGCKYKLAFTAFAEDTSIGREFTCGIHNINLVEGNNQEQYWTPRFVLSSDPVEYEFEFKTSSSGSFGIMIGTGIEEVIMAYFTNIRIVKE